LLPWIRRASLTDGHGARLEVGTRAGSCSRNADRDT
jgi:hypothetical protein